MQMLLPIASFERVFQEEVKTTHPLPTARRVRHPEIQNQNRRAKQTISLSCMSGIIRIRRPSRSNESSQITNAARRVGHPPSHTAQDIVRHDFEPASQHPWSEPPATPAEEQAAEQATADILHNFTAQMYAQGAREGFTKEQISALLANLQKGPPPPPPHKRPECHTRH
jgi:hypothetical protein